VAQCTTHHVLALVEADIEVPRPRRSHASERAGVWGSPLNIFILSFAPGVVPMDSGKFRGPNGRQRNKKQAWR
jgi:hypothetical protein